ncbi:XRE family transcriptional regulator [bacterium]|nr:XRE family transcriptional regulator [bacterium]
MAIQIPLSNPPILTREDSRPNPKRMLSYQLERAMAHKKISRVEMAEKLGTSRAALNRLLDPQNESVTLKTILRTVEVLGYSLILEVKENDK